MYKKISIAVLSLMFFTTSDVYAFEGYTETLHINASEEDLAYEKLKKEEEIKRLELEKLKEENKKLQAEIEKNKQEQEAAEKKKIVPVYYYPSVIQYRYQYPPYPIRRPPLTYTPAPKNGTTGVNFNYGNNSYSNYNSRQNTGGAINFHY